MSNNVTSFDFLQKFPGRKEENTGPKRYDIDDMSPDNVMQQRRVEKLNEKKDTEIRKTAKIKSEPDFYEVEKIINHRIDFRKRDLKFLVKWKGYDEEDSTWESFGDFARDAPELVQDYLLSFFDGRAHLVPEKIYSGVVVNFRGSILKDQLKASLIAKIPKLEEDPSNDVLEPSFLDQKRETGLLVDCGI